MVTELFAVKEFHHLRAAEMFAEYFGGRIEELDDRFLVWYVVDQSESRRYQA